MRDSGVSWLFSIKTALMDGDEDIRFKGSFREYLNQNTQDVLS